MKIETSLTVISLISLALGAPTSNDDVDKLTVTKSLFPDNLVQYTGQHEIVSLLLPINGLNLEEEETSTGSDSDSNENELQLTSFFVEADINSDGNRVDQNLYVLKQGHAKKLLDHGRDAAASFDMSKLVFFGAADGIYVYNKENNSADKYGTVSDSIIGIAKEATGDVIYILTENHEVYKVSNEGTTKEKINDIVNAKQIVLDYSNNIYFYSDDKQAYVHSADGVKKIEGLPENPKSVNLIKPPFILDNAVLFLVDNVVHTIYANGTSKQLDIEFSPDAVPSAFSPEPFLTQLYAYDKKIYEYNIFAILFREILHEIRTYVIKATDQIGPVSLKGKILMRNQ
ncbi:unnamed protein product [Euphydryas editha]|uniref:Uncharacterized protein n=1 Tax=Euphydryas editha TaxID=104508 RepID=A0AAU9UFV1_EUPED|nr:unnamed protein product [Euphydryas editha]